MKKKTGSIWSLIDGCNNANISLSYLCSMPDGIFLNMFYEKFKKITLASANPFRKIYSSLEKLSMSEEALSLKKQVSAADSYIYSLKGTQVFLGEEEAKKVVSRCMRICNTLEKLSNHAIEEYLKTDNKEMRNAVL